MYLYLELVSHHLGLEAGILRVLLTDYCFRTTVDYLVSAG